MTDGGRRVRLVVGEALLRVWWNCGNDIYFKEHGNKGQMLRGTGKLKKALGNREHKKTNFDCWRIGEQAN